MGCTSSSSEEAAASEVLQALEKAGFPIAIPLNLPEHQKQARKNARRAMATALEADKVQRLAHAAAEAGRAAAARDPAYVEAQHNWHASALALRQQPPGSYLHKMQAPMKLLPLEVLRAHRALPRSSEVLVFVELNQIPAKDRLTSFIVFLSHHWFSEDHPDKFGLKFAIVMAAVDRIKDTLEPGTEVYLWIDFYCIDQDDAALKLKGILSLPAYMYNSDAVLTPWTDKMHALRRPDPHLLTPRGGWDSHFSIDLYQITSSNRLKIVANRKDMEKFRSLNLDDPHGYFVRGWCCMEMYLAMRVPLQKGTYQYFEKVGLNKWTGERPHFLAGDLMEGTPMLLPPRWNTSNQIIQTLNPVKGFLTYEADRAFINKLMNQNPLPTETAKETVSRSWGDSRNGHGVFVSSPPGLCYYVHSYEGQVASPGLAEGYGVHTLNSGDEYAGVWKPGQEAGVGVARFASGGTYRGRCYGGHFEEVRFGVRVSSEGNQHAGGAIQGSTGGEIQEGSRHGPGVFVAHDGLCEEGSWNYGVKQGLFTITYPRGDVEVGEWDGGEQKDGWRTITFAPASTEVPGGGVENCYWINGERNGQWQLTRPSGVRVVGIRSPSNSRGGLFTVFAPDGRKEAEELDLDFALARSLMVGGTPLR